MAIWYVKKMDKNVNLIKKLINPINIKQVENKVIVQIPNEKYVKKLEKRIYDKQNQNLVIMKNLNREPFCKICNVLDGKWLFRYMIPNILEYISEQSKIDGLKQEISVMINSYNQNDLKLLAEIAQKVKIINLVSENINAFSQLEKYLLDEKGIAIRITNNKKKSLIKSSIIFNFDFSENKFNQFSIPRKAIIINTSEKISIKSKRFEGINCNYYEASLPKEFEEWFIENGLYGLADESILLESMLYYKNSYESIKKLTKDIKVKWLVGSNGIIQKEELNNFFIQNS